jgi:hypothetical protein
VVIGGLGIAAPFWINALSNFAVTSGRIALAVLGRSSPNDVRS